MKKPKSGYIATRANEYTFKSEFTVHRTKGAGEQRWGGDGITGYSSRTDTYTIVWTVEEFEEMLEEDGGTVVDWENRIITWQPNKPKK